MVTADEDEMNRSIEAVNAHRTRAQQAAAKTVRDLAIQHDELVQQTTDVARQLRKAVVSARGVMELEELATHLKRSVAEVTAWADGVDGKSTRRSKPTNSAAKSSSQATHTNPARATQQPVLPSPQT
jgi:hypothetical protein